MDKNVIEKYLKNYAEDEINYIPQTDLIWDNVICIPCYNEYHELIDLIENNLPKIVNNTLVIININANKDSSEKVFETNNRLISYLKNKAGINNNDLMSFFKFNNYDILLIDKTNENRFFDSKFGVGLARKIGADVALKLIYQGNIKSNWIKTTDADVKLSSNYLKVNPDKKYSAITYTFFHNDLQDNSQGLALQLYEIYLRYYYLGLIYAESPYAFHTVGSSMGISAEHYAKVRGFPKKREAAEDFYMLNKLAKTGKIYREIDAIINIKGRESDRVPFGTGASMAKISNILNLKGEYTIYNPLVFDAIKNIYEIFGCFIQDLSTESINYLIEKYELESVFNEFGLKDMLNNCLTLSKDPKIIKGHINNWFDAFKILKVINYLSRNKYHQLVWSNSLNNAPFIKELNLDNSIENIRNALYLFEIDKTKELNNYGHSKIQ